MAFHPTGTREITHRDCPLILKTVAHPDSPSGMAYRTLSAKGIFLTRQAAPQISGTAVTVASRNLSSDSI